MNPFTLKELRQLTRSRAISATLMLFLFACVVATYLFPLGGIKYDTGGCLVGVLTLMLAIAFDIILPLNIFMRMQKERRGKTAADLTLVTPLPPAAIIDGKLRSAYALMFLLSSAALPFFVAAYLLHGITFVEMFKILAMLVAYASVSVHVTIAIASGRLSPAMRVILFGIFMLHSLYTLLGSIFIGHIVCDMPSDSFIVTLALLVSISFLVRAYAVALLSPRTMERDFAIRWTTLAFVVGWLAYTMVKYSGGDAKKFHDTVLATVVLALAVVGFVMIRAIAQDAGYSKRQLAARPAAKWRRILRWPFASGAVNGLFFASVLALALGAVMPLMEGKGAYEPLICSAYILALAMYFRAAWYQLRRFVRIPPALLPVGVGLVFAFLQTFPALEELNGGNFFSVVRPFFLHDLGDFNPEHLTFSLIALALGFLVMLPETIAAFKQKGN